MGIGQNLGTNTHLYEAGTGHGGGTAPEEDRGDSSDGGHAQCML